MTIESNCPPVPACPVEGNRAASVNPESSHPFRMRFGKTLAIEACGLRIRQNTGLLLAIHAL